MYEYSIASRYPSYTTSSLTIRIAARRRLQSIKASQFYLVHLLELTVCALCLCNDSVQIFISGLLPTLVAEFVVRYKEPAARVDDASKSTTYQPVRGKCYTLRIETIRTLFFVFLTQQCRMVII